jgi:predicted ArsR family transcriptional regulator
VTPWTKWPALGQPVYVRPGSLNGNANSGAVFASQAERRALLLRMGSGPTACGAYVDTLARAAGMSRNALKRKLDALEHEGLVAAMKAPAGLRYRLTEDGRRVRAG